jgi:hypothetical protein
MTRRLTLSLLLVAVALAAACSGRSRYIRGTQIPDSADNREIINTIERYRLAVERRDAAALLAMASPRYWEDGGTAKADDDYGYEGLRTVLAASLPRVDDVRYSLRYVKIQRKGNVAQVFVYIDGSYTLSTRRGTSRPDQKDPGQLVLERDGGKWLFLSGM